MNRLAGKVAVVTGGNSGIGLATAQLFAQEGATVVITGRDQVTLEQAASEIGNGTVALRLDVSKLAKRDQLFAQVKNRFGGLDILFASARPLSAPTPGSTALKPCSCAMKPMCRTG